CAIREDSILRDVAGGETYLRAFAEVGAAGHRGGVHRGGAGPSGVEGRKPEETARRILEAARDGYVPRHPRLAGRISVRVDIAGRSHALHEPARIRAPSILLYAVYRAVGHRLRRVFVHAQRMTCRSLVLPCEVDPKRSSTKARS